MKPPYDLRDYLFDELNPEQRAEVEAHLKLSAESRQEMEQLKMAHKALLSLPEEEIPRRLAFVSDKVFEPSTPPRLWQRLWAPVERFSFGAAMALLVLFSGLWVVRPSLTVNQEGWHLVFGVLPESTAVEERVSDPQVSATLTAEQARKLVVTLIAENDEQLRKDILRQIQKTVANESERSEHLWKVAVEQLRRESEQGWRILRTDFEDLAYTTSAGTHSVGFTR